jgi:hypothetical protein
LRAGFWGASVAGRDILNDDLLALASLKQNALSKR